MFLRLTSKKVVANLSKSVPVTVKKMKMYKVKREYKILPLVQPNPDETPIDKEKIYSICINGLEDAPPEDRCIGWLVMLGVYPSNPNTWLEKRDEILKNYVEFKNDFQINDWQTKVLRRNSAAEELDVDDKQMMVQIHKDIVRTKKHFKYFPPAPPPENSDPEDQLRYFNEYLRRTERVLYIFGKINMSLWYMQGFNELVTPLFYVFLQSREVFYGNMDLVEAVTFHCLQQLVTSCGLSEFYSMMDQQKVIMRLMGGYDSVLERHLPKVADHLKTLGIGSYEYCYKWLNTLFSQEFEMFELLTLWDAMFAHQPRVIEFTFYLAVAYLWPSREEIPKANFGKCMTLLQSPKRIKVTLMVQVANDLWNIDARRNSLPSILD